MVWLWLLFPLVTMTLTLALWRAATALARERADLQAEVGALGPLAERARRVRRPGTPHGATGQEQVHR